MQLTTCKGCDKDVDPYIEREWLLVVMDCILHRCEAFRHVLYNREPFAKIFAKEMVADNNNFDDFREILRYSIIATLIRTYLWHAIELDEQNENGLYSSTLFVVLFQSFVGENIMAVATIVSSFVILKMDLEGGGKVTNTSISKQPTERNDISTSFFFSRLYLAVTIPSFFHLITIFSVIWENSSTVYFLGALFVLSLQRIGIATVIDERLRTEEIGAKTALRQNVSLRIKQSIPLLLGIVAREFCLQIVNKVLGKDLSECIGMQIGSFCIS